VTTEVVCTSAHLLWGKNPISSGGLKTVLGAMECQREHVYANRTKCKIHTSV